MILHEKFLYEEANIHIGTSVIYHTQVIPRYQVHAINTSTAAPTTHHAYLVRDTSVASLPSWYHLRSGTYITSTAPAHDLHEAHKMIKSQISKSVLFIYESRTQTF